MLSGVEQIGIHFNGIGAGALSIGGTMPLYGDWTVSQIAFTADVPGASGPNTFQVVLASDVLTTQAELNSAEQLFRGGSEDAVGGFGLSFTEGPSSLVVPGPFVIKARKRRLVVGFTNGGVAAADAYVLFSMAPLEPIVRVGGVLMTREGLTPPGGEAPAGVVAPIPGVVGFPPPGAPAGGAGAPGAVSPVQVGT